VNESKLYAKCRWKNRVSPQVKKRNPLCQRVDERTGIQCNAQSTIVHHIRAPQDAPNLAFDWSNLVALCANCHPGGERGELKGRLYAHTIGWDGEVVRKGVCYPSWHALYVQPSAIASAPESSSGLLPCGGVTSSCGDAALDAALERE